jgi:hypothetical protein
MFAVPCAQFRFALGRLGFKARGRLGGESTRLGVACFWSTQPLCVFLC